MVLYGIIILCINMWYYKVLKIIILKIFPQMINLTINIVKIGNIGAAHNEAAEIWIFRMFCKCNKVK